MKTLRQARQEKGISINELARRTGLTFLTIQRWEMGKAVPLVTNAITVAKELGVNVQDIDWSENILKS